MHRKIAYAAVAAAFLAAVPFGLAGRSTGATLTITPNDAPAWSRVAGFGCGYDPSTAVYIDIEKPEAIAFTGANVGADGCIDFTFTTDGPGTYHVQARQQLSNGKKWTVMATYDLPVVAG